MNVPRIDQITLSVDIAHLHVRGFILHAGARDRQHPVRATVACQPSITELRSLGLTRTGSTAPGCQLCSAPSAMTVW